MDLLATLRANPQVAAAFKSLPPSHRREYLRWIDEAKREGTRLRRIADMVERLTSGAQSAKR
ncbi:MAG: YdeI/OmpD-associated family protein [Pirellulales bacterium]